MTCSACGGEQDAQGCEDGETHGGLCSLLSVESSRVDVVLAEVCRAEVATAAGETQFVEQVAGTLYTPSPSLTPMDKIFGHRSALSSPLKEQLRW